MTGRRWAIEEDHEFGKDQFGFDQSQVRLYTPNMRHIVLVMAALAVCAVTAAQVRTRTPPPPTPDDPAQPPPADLGLIPLRRAARQRAGRRPYGMWRPSPVDDTLELLDRLMSAQLPNKTDTSADREKARKNPKLTKATAPAGGRGRGACWADVLAVSQL